MVSRRSVLLLCALLLGGVLVGVAATTGTPEPVVTLENDDNVTYHVTAYTVEDLDAAGYLNFEVTTDNGERTRVTYAELVWPSGYRNVTLADEGVNSQSFVVGPNETTTEPLEGWTRGDVTVYIVQGPDEHARTRSKTLSCSRRGQEHELRFSDGGFGGTTVCAGGIGWVVR